MQQTERRNAYRVATSEEDLLRADIIGERQRVTGEVLDLSLRGGAIRIAAAENPTFAIGEPVTVCFYMRPAGTVEVPARIETRSETDDARRFGLSFPDPAALRNKLNVGLFRLFNQRRAFRVEPSRGSRVEVHLRENNYAAVGLLQNISADGIALLIDAQVEASLANVTEVNLSFELPGVHGTHSLRAVIRNRSRAEDGRNVCYGLQFLQTGSNFPLQQQHIVDYVMRRQREDIQSRVER